MAPPVRSYLVCATPRSGSTLLCHLLAATGVAGRPEEYFEALRHSGVPRQPEEYFDPERHANIVERLALRELPDREGRPEPNPLWRPEAYDRYVDWALERGTTPNGVFGAKLIWGYLGDFVELLRGIEGLDGLPVPALLERVFPQLSYLQITREDKVRQAVSLWRAVQTQAWRRTVEDDAPGSPVEPAFSLQAINYLVQLLTVHDACWDAYFLGLGRQPLKVTYEELAAAPRETLARVLGHLGLDADAADGLAAPALQVQADERSEEWVRRVHEHMAALERPGP